MFEAVVAHAESVNVGILISEIPDEELDMYAIPVPLSLISVDDATHITCLAVRRDKLVPIRYYYLKHESGLTDFDWEELEVEIH